jgi:mRNA-degrading endonuclease YafQ of YafQ-DinJ toxin-antitoxin module
MSEEKLEIIDLYDEDNYAKVIQRIASLSSDSTPEWGSMSSAQMMAHCAEILEVMNGKPLQNTPFFIRIIKGVIRKLVVDNNPYPKNSKTHPQYKQTEEKDFLTEKKRLLNVMDEFVNESPEAANKREHPLFGPMTREERGWSMYKHLDHHLRQFGV